MALSAHKIRELRSKPAVNGNRVAAAIELADVNNVDVANATGFTQQYVSDVARGRFDGIKVANARKFAEYFGCLIEDLFPSREAVAS